MTLEVREALGEADPRAWLEIAAQRLSRADRALLARALELAGEVYGERLGAGGESLFSHWREVAGILSDLRMDAETVATALVSAVPALVTDWDERLRKQLTPQVATLTEGVGRMAQFQALRSRMEQAGRPAERAAQLESLRKMLLAMVQDARVVLIGLADQTQTLRYLAGHGEEASRVGAARDTFDLYAPLANRLGVWQLKWELEDLALRCSQPEAYKSIARQLDEKRKDREAFIEQVIEGVRRELAGAGISAEVTGRPKHIYSIYRKLARKDLGMTQLFDIRGVRVLVNDVKDCYTVLGLVHQRWTPLPREFDDYIAKPKPNNYRSLHTAVVGPDGKVLEVQIRTYEMHQQSEFGVAAHWRYKEGAGRGPTGPFEQRIAWLRQVLEWRDGLAGVADLAEHFRTGLFEDTVYVLTPQGRVVDLPKGSTPVDFAYHVHTELGHRCRGAKVDGEMVPLTKALEHGQTVEILAAKSGGPSRDWLNPELGYLHSSRARAKVRQWFHSQNLEASVAQGRQLVEKILQREGQTSLSLDKLAAHLHFAKLDELLAAVGRNEFTTRQLQTAVMEVAQARTAGPGTPAAPPETTVVPIASASPAAPGGDILIVGVDKLLTALARCCKPAPPDPIVGFVTRGRGVSVHRRSCSNVSRLPAERLIEAHWGADAQGGSFPVDLEIEGYADDAAIMRNLLDVLAREKVRVLAARSTAREPGARLLFTVEIGGLDALRRLLALMRELPGVLSARRR